MLAARVKREVAAGGAGRGGLGEGQKSEQQCGDREGDQEEFMPPPDRASAAAARRARWAVVGKLAICVTPTTLHQRCACVIPAPIFVMPALAAGISPSSARSPVRASAVPAQTSARRNIPPPETSREPGCRLSEGGGVGTAPGAGRSEIPAASAGMTDLVLADPAPIGAEIAAALS